MIDDLGHALLADIAENIAEAAEARGMALHILADFAGIARSTMFRLKAGNYDIGVVRLNMIAVALEMELSQLVRPRRPRKGSTCRPGSRLKKK